MEMISPTFPLQCYFISKMSEASVYELEKEKEEFGKAFDYMLRDPPCPNLPEGLKTYWLIGRQTKEGLQAIDTKYHRKST